MKTFDIPFWYRVSGTVTVEAEKREEAEEKAFCAVDDFGERAMSSVNDRDWGVP
jgi:hypothetical protein